MNIKRKIIPKGKDNRPGRSLTPLKVTIHNTANTDSGANASAHANYLITTEDKISWHFTCDDKEVYQHLPTNEIGYHAKNGNSKSIGIEICENKGIDQNKANDNAAKLCAQLLKQHALTVSDTVTHKYWTGKACPRLLLNNSKEGKKWSNFKEKVKNYFNQETNELVSNLLEGTETVLTAPRKEDDLIENNHIPINFIS